MASCTEPNYCSGVPGAEDVEEVHKDRCGGEDSFPFPSREGVPLRLDVRYVGRVRRRKLVSYESTGVIRRPVLVAYNLFALQADTVDYDATDGTMRAHGHVIFDDPSGQFRVRSAAFKFNAGKATRLW